MKAISEALVKAQKEFGPALKTSTNPHFKSKYADLAACIEAVIDGLNNNGIMLMQQCHESESGVIVETLFIHESGETFSAGKLSVPASKQDPQGYGSALTYARRYSLMAACGIAPEEDDGEAARKRKEEDLRIRKELESKKPELKKLTQSAVADLITSIMDAESMDALKKAFVVAHRAAEHVGDTDAMEAIEKAKDKRKTHLQNEIISQA